MAMNLKPFRDISAHEEINLFSTVEGDLTKGTVVEYVSAALDNQNGYGNSFNGVPDYAWSKDYVVNWKIQAAPSGSTKVAGVITKDVVSTINDPWAMDARFVSEEKLAEKQVIPSGRAVPFITRGLLRVVGYQGLAGPGSGIVVSNSGAGIMAVSAPTASNQIGQFITSSGADGSAIVRISL